MYARITQNVTRDLLTLDVCCEEELTWPWASSDAMSGQLWPDANVQRRSRCASLLPRSRTAHTCCTTEVCPHAFQKREGIYIP